MNIDNLNHQEAGLIEIIRTFNFLRQEGYYEKEITIAGRDLPSVVYHNHIRNRIIRIIGNEKNWSIIIERKRLIAFSKTSYVFDISDYFKNFNCSLIKGKNYSLKSLADFMKQHLMPVIRGDVWINELINKNKYGTKLV